MSLNKRLTQTTELIRIGQHPVRDHDEIRNPQENERVIFIEALSEFVAPIKYCGIVDKLEKTNKGQNFTLKIVR